MGIIETRIKDEVLTVFEQEKNITDLEQKLTEGGYCFEIKRDSGKTLKYDGSTKKFEYK
jgi:hypothetical protein